MTKVVITGMGALTHLGIGHEHLIQGLLLNEKVKPNKWISSEQKIELTGYRINDQDEKYKELLTPFNTRNMDRFAKINIAAVSLGIKDANLNKQDLEKSGYIMNTTYGPWESTNRYTKELLENGPAYASPRLFPNTVVNSAQGHVSISFKIKGPTSTLAGLSAIPYAVSLLKRGEAERIIVAGADEINENIMEAYNQLGSSVIFGEGVGVLVLETIDIANKRNAHIYGEIGEYALGCEPSMNLWFEGADIDSKIFDELLSDLSFSKKNDHLIVMSASNGSKLIEQLEQNSLQRLKNTYPSLERYYPKGVLGETFGASSILSVIGAIHLLNRQDSTKEALVLNNEIGGNHMTLVMKKWNH